MGYANSAGCKISIHVLREEDDVAETWLMSRTQRFLSTSSARRTTCARMVWVLSACYFYPRPPRGGRLTIRYLQIGVEAFLSTSSARRTTRPSRASSDFLIFLSTSSARRTT